MSKFIKKDKDKDKDTKKTKDVKGIKDGKSGKTKRGAVSKAIFELFAKVGVEKVKLEQAKAVAVKAKPDTTFDGHHLAWYKNKYRNQ